MEESEAQIIRNQRSVGIDLQPLVEQGLLKIYPARPTLYGLERHLSTMQKLVHDFKPRVIVLDPITNLISVGSAIEVKSMLTRLIDWLKVKQITSLYISLTSGGTDREQTEVGISSLMDTWLLLRDIELRGERNRGLYVLKSRGMSHSNQIREFLITDNGVELMDVYLGPEGVLTGTSRLIQEEQDAELEMARQQEITGMQHELDRKRQALEAQILALREEFAAQETAMNRVITQQQGLAKTRGEGKARIALSRQSDNGNSD